MDAVPLLNKKRADTIELTVSRKAPAETPSASPTVVKIKLAPVPVKSLGLRLELGKIAAVRNDSPASRAGIKIGDRLVKVDGRDVGLDLDPQRLPLFFYEHRDQPIHVVIQREVEGRKTSQIERHENIKPRTDGGPEQCASVHGSSL